MSKLSVFSLPAIPHCPRAVPASVFSIALLAISPLKAADPAEPKKAETPEKPAKIEVVQPDNFVLNLFMVRDDEVKADINVMEAGNHFYVDLGDPPISLSATIKFVDEASTQVLIEYTFAYRSTARKMSPVNKDAPVSEEQLAKEEEAAKKAINLTGSVKVNPNQPIIFFSNRNTEIALTLLQTGEFTDTSNGTPKRAIPNNARAKANAQAKIQNLLQKNAAAKAAAVRKVPARPAVRPPSPNTRRRVVLPPKAR